MKRSVASFLCIVSALACGRPVQAQDYGRVFEAVDRTVRENFYDPHFGGRDWPAIVDGRREELAGITTDAEFQRFAQAMLNELGVSHVVMHAPGTNRPTMGLGARWEIIDGRAIVVDIDPASGARAAGLRIGDHIRDPAMIRDPAGNPRASRSNAATGAFCSSRCPANPPTGRPASERSRGACSDGGTVGRWAIYAPIASATTPRN